MQESLSQLAARVRGFIRRSAPERAAAAVSSAETPTQEFAALAVELFQAQVRANAGYRAWCLRRGIRPEAVLDWRDIPAVPAAAFKELELTSIPSEERTAAFHSSGTTGQERSRHFHHAESLALYEASLRPWFERHLLGDWDELADKSRFDVGGRLPFLALTPPPEAATQSSLVHMLAVVRHDFGAADSLFAGRAAPDGSWEVDLERTLFALRKSMCANRSLVLLGTAFNFVHLLDHLAANNIRYRLAEGSRVMETGGYKGRSRELTRTELHALLTRHLGVPARRIVTEYGMSELGSQAYALRATDEAAGHFRFPPWARARVISPETDREVAEGETGLVRVLDLANVWSVLAVQTQDLAVRRGEGFELLGRARQAEPRGCSLMTA